MLHADSHYIVQYPDGKRGIVQYLANTNTSPPPGKSMWCTGPWLLPGNDSPVWLDPKVEIIKEIDLFSSNKND